nr:hypothetical protein CFP56_42942 [Quercus suber]
MDELFSISVHHGGHFIKNDQKYVGGAVDVIDNCDPKRWSKVKIESICRDFGYTSVSRLWCKMLGVDQELTNFHLIFDDSDAVFLTELVMGHEDIHVYVEHPIHDPILVDEGQDVGEGVQPLALEQDFISYYDNDDGSEHDDHDKVDFYSFYDSDGMYANDQTFNNEDKLEVNANVPTEVAASQMGSRKVGKKPIIEHPPEVFHISDSSDNVGSDGRGSGLEYDVEWNRGVRDLLKIVVIVGMVKMMLMLMNHAMGAGVMNLDYKSEELHSLVESSFNDELGYDNDDKSEDDNMTHVGDERE